MYTHRVYMDHMVRRFHNSPGHQDSLQVPTQQDSRANLTFQKSRTWLENPSLIGVLMGQSSINGYGKVNYSNNAKRFQDHGRTSTWQLFCWICIATWCRTCFRVSLLASIHWKSRPKIWHWNAPDFGWLFVLLPCLGTRLKLVVSTCLSTDWPDRNRSRSTRIIEHDLMTRRYLNGGLWYGESSPNGLGPWWIIIYPKASWIITGWILSWRKGLKPELYTWKGLQPQNDLVWGKICRRRSFLPLNTQFLPTIFG